MTIFETKAKVQPVSASAAGEYAQWQYSIQNTVSEALAKYDSIHDLTGNCPPEVLVDIQRQHTLFFSCVFQLNNYHLLARMLVWMYRAYHAHGFSYDYFIQAFSEWRKAVALHMSQPQAEEIDRVYQWIARHHSELVQLAESAEYQVFPNRNTQEDYSPFLTHLLHVEYRECLAIGETYLTRADGLARFYVEVIEPSLYEVGRRWETGKISVAQEHLATAVVNKVMLALFLRSGLRDAIKPKVVIVAAPNELHEVGAYMVADLLEQQGWDVDYLGANMPKAGLLEYLQVNKPYFLGLSVVMPFHLAAVREIIEAIRSDAGLYGVRIMVGGAAFRHCEDLWRQVGADAFAVDGHAAITIARKWLAQKQAL